MSGTGSEQAAAKSINRHRASDTHISKNKLKENSTIYTYL
jgi:hypothetical protein